MNSLAFDQKINNSKLFFSKTELTKILSCYSYGVSRGEWKDYAINYKLNEVNFAMFKHTLASPDCILTKFKKFKKNEFLFKLTLVNKKKNKFKKIDDLLIIVRRKYLKLI